MYRPDCRKYLSPEILYIPFNPTDSPKGLEQSIKKKSHAKATQGHATGSNSKKNFQIMSPKYSDKRRNPLAQLHAPGSKTDTQLLRFGYDNVRVANSELATEWPSPDCFDTWQVVCCICNSTCKEANVSNLCAQCCCRKTALRISRTCCTSTTRESLAILTSAIAISLNVTIEAFLDFFSQSIAMCDKCD